MVKSYLNQSLPPELDYWKSVLGANLGVNAEEASYRAGSSGHQLEHGKFHMNTTRNLFTVRVTGHRKRLHREVWMPSCVTYHREPALAGDWT